MNLPVGVIEGGFQEPVAVRAMAEALEAAGADAAFVTDHPAPDSAWLHAHGHDAVDPFTALAFVAACSTKLLLHTNILVLPYRNPFITAKASATLQALSGGRLILGVGIGYQEVEFDALGVDFTRRGALTNEALAVLELAWGGGPVSFVGHGFRAAAVEPRPVPRPRPRVWIGGGSDHALERAARYGDGWSPFIASPHLSAVNRTAAIHSLDELGTKITRVRERRSDLGRTEPFEVTVDLRGQGQPGDRSSSEARRFVDLLGELGERGVDWTCVTPTARDLAEYLDAVEWYGVNVIAHLPRS